MIMIDSARLAGLPEDRADIFPRITGLPGSNSETVAPIGYEDDYAVRFVKKAAN